MIRHLLKRAIRRFGDRYGNDTGYMTHVTDISTSAGVRLSLLPLYTQFRGPVAARDVWAGAVLGSTLEGDCGPCVQLVVDMAQEAGVAGRDLALCLQGRLEEAGDAGLGVRFALAAIADGPDLDALREQIARRFGEEAVIACAFAASGGRIYPVLKRGFGYGKTCARVQIGGEMIGLAAQQ